MPVERHRDAAVLADEWDDLADRAGAVPSMRPGWVMAWADAFARRHVEALALRVEGRLAAVVPFVRRVGAVRSPTNYHTPDFGLLAEDAEAALELARALFARRPHTVSFSFLDPARSGLDALRTAARTHAYTVGERVLERSPVVRVDGDFESYVDGLDRRHVKDVQRRRRRLAEQGELSFAVSDGRERLDELLAEAWPVEGSGWKEEAGTAVASSANTLRFYTEIARWAAARGMLRLAFLRLDGRPIAVEVCLADGGHWLDLKGGYDQEFRKAGPGSILAYELLHHVFAEGGRSFDFLGDAEPFKLEWTSVTRERRQLNAFAPTLAGRAGRVATAYGRPLARRAYAAVERLRR